MEIFFTEQEHWQCDQLKKREFILVNPHVKRKAPPNKRWPFEYYQDVVDSMCEKIDIIQPKREMNEPTLERVTCMELDLRQLAVYISTAALIICNEGLLHHIAAAFSTPAIVLFGGYIPANVTGYDYQQSIYVQDKDVIGVREETEAGQAIMKSISPEHVVGLAEELLWTS